MGVFDKKYPEAAKLADKYVPEIKEMLLRGKKPEKPKKVTEPLPPEYHAIKAREKAARENGYQPDLLQELDQEDLAALEELPL